MSKQPNRDFAVKLRLAGRAWARMLAMGLTAPLWAASGATETLTVLKKMSVEELMEIEVTSVSRHPERLLEAASAIQVVTGEDIRRAGATSLPEALRLAGNLDVAQKNAHDWGISARGFNTELANKLLVMVDGRTVYTPLFSGVFWDVQDYLLEDVDRIEVISGPGGTLWGANAVNGVINVLTRSARETQGLYLDAGGGTELRAFTGARYGATLAPNVFFRVYGKYLDRGASVRADGKALTDTGSMGRGGFRMDAETSPQNTFTLQGDYYRGRNALVAGGQSEVSGGNVLGRWTHTFSDRSDLRLQVYYDRTHLAQSVPPLVLAGRIFAPAGTLKDDLDTWDLDFQHQFKGGDRHRLVWGAGYRFTHDATSNAPALALLPATLNRDLLSGFVQDEIALRTDLSLTLGTKIEHNDYTGREVEPNARVQWEIAPANSLWAAVSRAVRTPSRIDRYLSQAAPPNLVVLKGGADFGAETVLAYEMGFRTQLGAKATVSLATFYNDYDDVRSTSMTPATLLPFFFANNLEGETHGLELSGSYQASASWRLRASYNLLKEHLRIKPGHIDINAALNETSDPAQRCLLHSSVNFARGWEWDAGLRWTDERPTHSGAVAGMVPGYFELDLRLGWRVSKALELSVVGQNLLHDQHVEYGYPGTTRGELQRSVHGKLTWRF